MVSVTLGYDCRQRYRPPARVQREEGPAVVVSGEHFCEGVGLGLEVDGTEDRPRRALVITGPRSQCVTATAGPRDSAGSARAETG